MMELKEILLRLRNNEVLLHKLKVRSLAVFGSVARDEHKVKSDIDLLIEFTEPIGLFHFTRTQRELEELLEMKVDLVHREAVRKELEPHILDELIPAWP